MQPEAGERFAGQRFRLRDFVFVVREDKVDAAGVQIERFAEILNRHDRAFDVPAGPARSERSLPEALAFLGGFPESEITSVGLLITIHVNSGAGDIAAEIVVRELAVLRE